MDVFTIIQRSMQQEDITIRNENVLNNWASEYTKQKLAKLKRKIRETNKAGDRSLAVGVVNNSIFNVIITLELSQDSIFVMTDKL